MELYVEGQKNQCVNLATAQDLCPLQIYSVGWQELSGNCIYNNIQNREVQNFTKRNATHTC
jgi:hypothetical protein